MSAVLELTVLFLAIHHKLFKRHPLFTVYLALLIVEQSVMAVVYTTLGIGSYLTFWIFWTLQAILVLWRGSAVYEFCRVLLAPFAGVWRICRGFLLLTAGTLAVSAYFAASQSGPRLASIISTAERGLELAIVGILLIGLAFCRYYGIRIDRYMLWIGLGFGFYSALQVVNNTFLRQLLLSYLPIWREVAVFSFDIATLLWCVALWKPLPVPTFAPAMLEPGAYEALAPRMNSRLRNLNALLMEMWK